MRSPLSLITFFSAVSALQFKQPRDLEAESHVISRRDIFDSPDEVLTVWKTEYANCGCPTTLPYNIVNVNGDPVNQGLAHQDSVVVTATESPAAATLSPAQAIAGVLDGVSTSTTFTTLTATSTQIVHRPSKTVQIISSADGVVVEVSDGVTYTITSTVRVTQYPSTVTLTHTATPAGSTQIPLPVGSVAASQNGDNSRGATIAPLNTTPVQSSTIQTSIATTTALVPTLSTAIVASTTSISAAVTTSVIPSSGTFSTSITPVLSTVVTSDSTSQASTTSSVAVVPVSSTTTSQGGSAGVSAIQKSSTTSSFTVGTLPAAPSVYWSNSSTSSTSRSSQAPIAITSSSLANAGQPSDTVAGAASTSSFVESTSASHALILAQAPVTVISAPSSTTSGSTVTPNTTGPSSTTTPMDTQTWPSPTSTTTIITYVTQSAT